MLSPRFASAEPAVGERASRLQLQVIDCPESTLASQRLIAQLRAEIAPAVLELSVQRPTTVGVSAVVTLCEAQAGTVGLELIRDGSSISQRQVALGEVGTETRTRIVAVILAEMLVAANGAPVVPPETAPTHVPAKTPPARQLSVKLVSGSVVQEDVPHWNASAGLLSRIYGRSESLLWGSWVGARYRSFAGELLFARATAERPIGDLRLSYAALATAFSPFDLLSRPRLTPRIRLESGISWATGTPSRGIASGQNGAAASGAGMLELGLELPLSKRIAVELRMTGGYSGGLTATVDGVPTLSTSGWVVGVGLGAECGL